MNRQIMESLADRIAEHAAHLDAAMHRLLTDLRQFDQGGGWYQQGARSCAQWLAWRVGWDGGTAREHVRVANRLGALPLIDDELRCGRTSYAKVRAMTRVATAANESMLLEEARHSTGAQLELICRKYKTVQRHDDDTTPADDQQRRFVARHDTADGMVRIEAVLHPEEAALVWAALDRVASEQCREACPETATIAKSASPRDIRGSAETSGDLAASPVPSSIAPGSAPSRIEHDLETAKSASRHDNCVSAETSTGPAHAARADSSVAAPIATHPDLARADLGDGRTDRATRAHDGAGRTRAGAFSRADALVALAGDVVRGTRKDRSPTELVITVASETLHTCAQPVGGSDLDPHDMSGPTLDPSAVAIITDGTCISAQAARRLACDCGVVHVVENERGTPLSVGRRVRSIPGAMKRALLRRDQTCRFPGCSTRVFLEGHHIQHWADGGETKLANMVSLCSHHHRYLHEYKYVIEVTDAGDIQFLNDRGRLVTNAPAPAYVTKLGWESLLEHNDHLKITPDTAACLWDGRPVNYRHAVDALICADRR